MHEEEKDDDELDGNINIMNVVFGKCSKINYTHIALEKTIGKKIEAVGFGYNINEEPMSMLFFSDGTKHGFVHPCDN